jgi:hypothetical protein
VPPSDLQGFVQAGGQGLFDQDRDAGRNAFERLGEMNRIRCCDVDRIDCARADHRRQGAECGNTGMLAGKVPRLGQIARADGRQDCAVGKADVGDELRGNCSGAGDTPADGRVLGHARL